MYRTLEVIKAVMLGHAVADALGVPVEFRSREELDAAPVTEMRGFGSHKVPAGSWSDDTSMALATLDVLRRGEIDYNGIMDNFVAWSTRDEFTPTGIMFDVGGICLSAIGKYLSVPGISALECGSDDEYSNGNGSLMRIHPMSLYLYFNGTDRNAAVEIIHNASALTHSHMRSKIACGIYSFVLWALLDNPCRESVIKGLREAREYYLGEAEFEIYDKMLMSRIGGLGEVGAVTRDEIKSSGYVVDSLEAAVWCLLTTDSYKDCVLRAVNLGNDSDTVAAIAGGLAGALYGLDSIPKEWLEVLIKRDYIEEMCDGVAAILG